MNLQDWSNVAQVIGALAVVISLVYVGFQVKRNTSAVRSATSQAVHNNHANWYMSMVGAAIPAPDEQNALLTTGLGAGDGLLVVPAGSILAAYGN